MKTTSIYIELIVIGMQTLLWILILLFNIIGFETISRIHFDGSSPILLLVFLATCYILGILFDRFADHFYISREEERRLKSEITSQSSLLIWERAGHKDYLDYIRSRIRIIRATVLNFVPIIISLELTICRNIGNPTMRMLSAVFVLAIGLSGIVVGHRSLLKLFSSFYDKGRMLEVEIEKQMSETIS